MNASTVTNKSWPVCLGHRSKGQFFYATSNAGSRFVKSSPMKMKRKEGRERSRWGFECIVSIYWQYVALLPWSSLSSLTFLCYLFFRQWSIMATTAAIACYHPPTYRWCAPFLPSACSMRGTYQPPAIWYLQWSITTWLMKLITSIGWYRAPNHVICAKCGSTTKPSVVWLTKPICCSVPCWFSIMAPCSSWPVPTSSPSCAGTRECRGCFSWSMAWMPATPSCESPPPFCFAVGFQMPMVDCRRKSAAIWLFTSTHRLFRLLSWSAFRTME